MSRDRLLGFSVGVVTALICHATIIKQFHLSSSRLAQSIAQLDPYSPTSPLASSFPSSSSSPSSSSLHDECLVSLAGQEEDVDLPVDRIDTEKLMSALEHQSLHYLYS